MHLLKDLRFGFRSLVGSPGLTLVALVALALGIGVNATVFSLTNTVLYKGFPFDKSDRILYLLMRNVRNDRFAGVSYPDFRDWREQAKSFEGLAASGFQQTHVADDTNLPEMYPTTLMSANSFRLIGQKPVVGRDFRPEDEMNSVNQRTQEIGVRMAMGATARHIQRLVFAQGMRQVAFGLVIGLAGALALTRVLKSVLVQVSPSDPGTFVVASAALAVAAAFGCFVPARRAMTVEPVVALHHE